LLILALDSLQQKLAKLNDVPLTKDTLHCFCESQKAWRPLPTGSPAGFGLDSVPKASKLLRLLEMDHKGRGGMMKVPQAGVGLFQAKRAAGFVWLEALRKELSFPNGACAVSGRCCFSLLMGRLCYTGKLDHPD